MKNKIFIITIFIIGILLRLYPVIKQPLWLDEIYSLYFASNFSVFQILFHLPDCHPGLFYLILKGLIAISLNPIFLRLSIATFPEIIGCLIIQHRFKKPFLTTIFLLNPFFIHYAWQIRMYGLVFLFTIIIFCLITQKKISPKKILITLFIANLISYSFIIPSFCIILYLAFTYQKKWLLIIPLIFIEFIIFKGPQYKTFAETASWITIPSFTNIPSTIITSLGIDYDINSQKYYSIFFSLIFYSFFSTIIFFQSKKHSFFFFAFTLPILLTIFVSIAFPFLSLHRFFYLFIPKLSIFIPRFLIPLSVFFFIYVFNHLSPFKSLSLISIFTLLWINPYIKLNINSYYKSIEPLTSGLNTLFLPPHENLRLQKKYSLLDIKNISKNYDSAELIGKQLLNTPSNCTLFHHYSKIIYLEQPISSLENYQKQIKSAITECISKSL